MKRIFLIIAFASWSKAIVSVSEKQFPSISLINHYEYFNGEHEFNGKLVGIVSNSEFSLFAMKKMLAPVGTVDLKAFLDQYLNK